MTAHLLREIRNPAEETGEFALNFGEVPDSMGAAAVKGGWS